jgi:acyl-CoA synthetase (NDP forming)
MSEPATLGALFAPRSIAIVGASVDATRIGGRPVDYLRSFGYSGAIYPVNPHRAEIQGLRAYASLSAIDAAVDLAVVAVPAAQVLATLEEAVATGVKAVVLFSSGFAEVDEAGRAEQARITTLARASGMRIVGPNCLGIMSGVSNVYATFSPVPQTGRARRGSIALASQSGAFGAYAYYLARERGLGLSHWITTGNEADVELADAIAFFATDPETRVILAYCEGVRDGPRFIAALEAARAAGKPVAITKVGRTAIGAQAAASHTAALAGEDAVYDAVFAQYGAIRARSVEEMFDLGYAFSAAGSRRGERSAIVTVSGGVGVLMADEAIECGLALHEPSAEAQATIRERIPFAATRNPIDVTGQVGNDHSLWSFLLDALLRDGRFDAVCLFFSVTTLAPAVGPLNLALCRWLRATYPNVLPIVVSALTDALRAEFEAMGCLCFTDPTRAIRAFAAIARFGTDASSSAPPVVEPLALSAGAFSEPEALGLLGRHGVPVIPHAVATSPADAACHADRLGYPVVLKVVSRGIPHKTEAGGVRLRLGNAAEVERAYAEIIAAARDYAPAARIDGVLVAPMISGGVECILGVQRDPVFGPVVMVGLGGIHVEVLKDVAFRRAPFDAAEARRMIDALRGKALFEGVRGAPAVDVDALATTLAALSCFAAAAGDTLASLDLNPFVVRPRGQAPVALDALIVGRSR